MPQTKPRLVVLGFETINQLSNGAAGDAIDKAIQRVVKDFHEYGKDGKSRKVVVEINIQPCRMEGKDAFKAAITAKAVLPDVKPVKTHGVIEVRGETVVGLFNPASASHVDQLTFDDFTDGEEGGDGTA
jgi:hypothetical protein